MGFGLLKEDDNSRLPDLRLFFHSTYDACGDERGEHLDTVPLRPEV
jgi:hypothetical protein